MHASVRHLSHAFLDTVCAACPGSTLDRRGHMRVCMFFVCVCVQVGLNFDDVRMVPAKYAFVIHTRNPSNNDESEVFCELVIGLGESLVSGMIAGSAVAFKAKKDNLDSPEVLCYASKSEGMFVRESLIFRSDSNGEDLEGYAGKKRL